MAAQRGKMVGRISVVIRLVSEEICSVLGKAGIKVSTARMYRHVPDLVLSFVGSRVSEY